MRWLVLLGINLVVTLLIGGNVGPGVFKLGHIFGLIPWAARAPFYLLQLYIAPAVIWLSLPRQLSSIRGALVGLAGTFPLVLWSVGTKCILAVPIASALSGVAQGGLIAWRNNKWRVQPDGRPSTV
jgi:hypothetical protein